MTGLPSGPSWPNKPHDTALLRPAPAGLQTLAGLGFPLPPLHRPFLWPARVLSLNESSLYFLPESETETDGNTR